MPVMMINSPFTVRIWFTIIPLLLFLNGDAQIVNDSSSTVKHHSKIDDIYDNSYRVSWTDDQTSTLKITYDNGKVKTIRDYGLIGTFGLSQAYKLLFDLRGSQPWN